MEYGKKVFVGIILSSLFIFLVVPSFAVKAQTSVSCDPDALKPASKGQRGANVKNLQACLIEAGYDIPAGPTGYYGPQTVSAVLKFYKDNDMQDGINLKGNRIGPKGIAALKDALSQVSEEPSEEPGEEPSTTTPSTGSQQQQPSVDQIVASVIAALRAQGLLQQQPTSTGVTGTTGEEGILTVDTNPTPASGQQFREGETLTWLGVRFRAQDSDIRVKSFKVTWPSTNNVAPQRVVVKFEIVDEQGNVLKTIPASDFTQEISGNLDSYYYVTGLDYVVPKNTYKALYIKAYAVSTFPSGLPTSFNLQVSEVRGRDNAGIDRFPAGTASRTVTPQSTVATSARFDVSKSVSSPVENNVVGDYVTGRANNVRLLDVELLARNDRVRLMKLVVNISGSATASVVYLKDDAGNTIDSAAPSGGTATFTNVLGQNIWVERDQTKKLSIYADFTGVTTSEVTSTVSVASLQRQNSLGDTGSQSVSGVSGDLMHIFTEAPVFAKGSTFDVSITRDQNNSTTTANATLYVNVTARGSNIKISSTSVFTLAWERNNTTTVVTTSVAATEVKDQSGNTVAQDTNGYYNIPVNQTYTFVLQNQQIFTGAPRVRVKVNGITWRNSANSDITSGSSSSATETWVGRDLKTNWSN